MTEAPARLPSRHRVGDLLMLGLTPRAYLRSLATPGNAVAGLILAVGVPVIVYRFAFGLGAATNLSQATPWGLWIGLDVLSGVALAAGGFVVAAAVHVFGLERYEVIVRPAILTAFLGYLFVIVGLVVDLGRPWNLPVPIVWSWGTASVMFEVAWCVCLYTIVLALEFSPAVFEWLGWRAAHAWAVRLTVGLTVFGVILSTLHQSSLGALFLMAPHRLHPLWYSPFIPVCFFVSAVAAGLSMVIVESALSHRAFQAGRAAATRADLDRIAIDLGKAAAVVLFAAVFLRVQAVVGTGRWDLLLTTYGAWWFLEVAGFMAAPALAFAWAARHARPRVARVAAAWTVCGVVLNRVNVSMVAMNWNAPERYLPSWMEVATSLAIITAGLLVFRWIVNRMPILHPRPGTDPHRPPGAHAWNRTTF